MVRDMKERNRGVADDGPDFYVSSRSATMFAFQEQTYACVTVSPLRPKPKKRTNSALLARQSAIDVARLRVSPADAARAIVTDSRGE